MQLLAKGQLLLLHNMNAQRAKSQNACTHMLRSLEKEGHEKNTLRMRGWIRRIISSICHLLPYVRLLLNFGRWPTSAKARSRVNPKAIWSLLSVVGNRELSSLEVISLSLFLASKANTIACARLNSVLQTKRLTRQRDSLMHLFSQNSCELDRTFYEKLDTK